MQRIEEEEKKNNKNFLDDDIEQIDNFLSKATYNNSHLVAGDQHSVDHYGGINSEYCTNPNSKSKNASNDRQVNKKRKTEQNMSSGSAHKPKGISSQFLYQMQETSSK